MLDLAMPLTNNKLCENSLELEPLVLYLICWSACTAG